MTLPRITRKMQRVLMCDARTLMLLLCATTLGTGCRGGRGRADGPVLQTSGEPIGVQIMRVEPQLKSQRFSTLLGFESASDTVFIAPVGGKVERAAQVAHTGRYALRSEAKELRVKLPSLLPKKAFPGKWALLGGYLYSPDGAQVTLAQRRINVPPRRWTPAFIDVASASQTPTYVLQVQSKSALYLDDLMLIDNAQDVFVPPGNESNSLDGPWSIRRAGLYYVINSPGRFATKLLTAEAGGPAGWKAEETVKSRARFSSEGSQKSLTVYPDGRAYWDAAYRALSAAAGDGVYAQQHAAPARVEVAEEFGRVDRDTPGDADNDGYNESRGAYQIRATGPRMEIAFTPRTPAYMKPVFELSGMPPGKAVVTIEGRLVAEHERLPDGTLLVDIPARVNRATTVAVKIQ